MKTNCRTYAVEFKMLTGIQLDTRELSFIKEMAKHCLDTDMRGNVACQRLIDLLTRAGVPDYDKHPVYGIFEEK